MQRFLRSDFYDALSGVLRRALQLGVVLIVLILGPSYEAAAEESVVPRTIIALYGGGDVQTSYIHSVAEMPLNHLGLRVEFHDIHEPLPEIADRKDVRGVITWVYGDSYDDARTFLKWAIQALDAGKKVVLIGSLGISDQDRRYTVSVLTNQFLGKIGLKMPGRWIGKPFDVEYQYNTPSMFLTKAPYEWIRPAYETMQVASPDVRAHLVAHRVNAPPGEDAALVVTSPTGGYLDADYAIRANKRGQYDVSQWLVNPFEFFRLAFATDDLPKPDVTTLAGRRIYYSNIDGDGWNNVTRLEQYRGKKVLSAQIILDRAIKPYPDLPVLVAPIAGDLDPKWVGSEDARRIARDFWAEPQVEAGTHTYSHPFYWMFFQDGKPDREIPYLYRYKTAVWKPKTGLPVTKTPPPPLPDDYVVPRAFANEPFDIKKEISGSIEAMSPLLPAGKKIEVLAWSGDCTPWEDAIRMTREAHLQNINGGDSRFDPEYPAYATVAPIGRQVGKERQIFNSTSNEISYTDSWEDDFYAFGYLKATLYNTETPMRLSPMSIYYHIYSGEREASLNALLGNLDYARTQDIAPLTVSHYTHIAEGFYDTKLVLLAPNTWRVEDRGALQTIRFDRSTLRSVDFERSHGIVGERHFQGDLYVYLDEKVEQPVIALKEDNRYYRSPEEATAYLIESRWPVWDLSRTENGYSFMAQGFGDGDMIWQVPAAGRYHVVVNGKTENVDVTANRLLTLHLTENALTPLHIIITGGHNG